MQNIREALKSCDPALLTRAEALIQHSSSIAIHSPSSFPTATSHGREHLETVEKIADLFLPHDLLAQLKCHELFYLLLAIHYHDLGMIGEENEFNSTEGRDQIRRQHAVSVGEKIISNWAALGFQNENEARILADVCRGHRPSRDTQGNATWHDLDQVKAIGPSASIRLRLVAALIYAIDELHIGDDRAKQRLQDWINIESEESRRHWQRHNEIKGPVESGNGGIQYDAIVKTKECEDDLRRNVFSKAFSAIADLNRQISAENIDLQIPLPSVQWDRTELWKLQIITCDCIDEGCTLEQLETKIFEAFKLQNATQFSLDGKCVEVENEDAQAMLKIRSTIEQLHKLNLLEETGNSEFLLSISRQSVRKIGEIVREADELDALFKGKFHGNHEFDLHCKRFGGRFVDNQVLPIIKAHYGFNPDVQEIDRKLVAIIKASPSAARFAVELKPIPTDLVKRRLLATVVIAGFSRDCLQNPSLILDKEVRHAFREVARFFTANYDRTIDFYEELALLGGFDTKKLGEIFEVSDEWKEEANKGMPQQGEETTIKMSQNIADDQPLATTGFSYFLLAGLRSGTHIEIRCNDSSSTSCVVNPSASLDSDAKEMQEIVPFSFTVGPGQASRLPSVDLRCKPSFDLQSKTLTLSAAELADDEHREFPFIVSCPSAEISHGEERNINLRFTSSKFTVDHALNLWGYSGLDGCGKYAEVQLALVKTGAVFATFSPNATANFGELTGFPFELIEKIAAYDKHLSVPWFMQKSHKQLILNAEERQLGSVFQRINDELQGSKEIIPTFTMIHQNESEHPYKEEFLGFFPGVDMPAPRMETEAEFSNAEIEKMWVERKKLFKFETRLREDTAQIAAEFRKWANKEQDWPVSVDPTLPHFHQTKTIYSLIRLPFIDRFWYTEAPNLIILRPTSRREQLETEMKYWESIGDKQREQLAKEKIARIDEAARLSATQNERPSIETNLSTIPKKTQTQSKKTEKKRKRKLAQKQRRHSRRKK